MHGVVIMFSKIHNKPHFNFEVSGNNPENDIKKIILTFRPTWNEELHFKGTERSADEGLLNIMITCYRTPDRKDAVMFRIYRTMNVNKYLQKKYEAAAAQLVHDKYGFAPNVLATFNNGFCYDYIHGKVMNRIDIRAPENWRLIAKQLALLHTSKCEDVFQHKSNIAEFFDHLVSTYPTELKNPNDDYIFKKFLPSKELVKQELKLAREHAESLNSEPVFCHNDTRGENLVWNQKTGEIIFVDWECCGVTTQAREIAYHFQRYAGVDPIDFSLYPDKEFQLKWLWVYLETYFSVVKPNVSVTDSDVEKLYAQVKAHNLLLLIQWTMFISSTTQFGEDELPMNILGLSRSCYNEYLKQKNSDLSLKLPE